MNKKQLLTLLSSDELLFIDNNKVNSLKMTSTHKVVFLYVYEEYSRLRQYNPTPFIQNIKVMKGTATSRTVCNRIIREFKNIGVFLVEDYENDSYKKQHPTIYKWVVNITNSDEFRINNFFTKESKLEKTEEEWSNYRKNLQIEKLRGKFLPRKFDKFSKVYNK